MRFICRLTAFSLILSINAAWATPEHATPCVDGEAEGFPCHRVDLVAHVSLSELGVAGQEGNDLWGWTDPDTGKEYALMGVESGTVFVDVSDEGHPEVLGRLPTHSSSSIWRDVKVYQNYALIVSEASDHGLQVFDLTRLRNVISPPVTFTEDAHYGNFGRAHNIVVNEDTGFAYAVGSRQGTETCNAGLHMIDISNPLVPSFAGCFSADGYTHDAQCVVYSGPDSDYSGDEICLASNEDTLTIVDVT
ncbi:MAG: choice-of-anchor B family protein, partial [Gammaproteobacteria bacterium]|nr:choice-of-anchor B family protein [Gammaproteobacteria bacterium]